MIGHSRSAAECPFHKLWPLMQMLLEEISGDFNLIVDASDECNDPDHPTRLFKRLTLLSSLTNARVVLLSRHHATLNDSLAEAYRISVDPASVTPDISLYVAQEIDHTVSLRSIRQLILTKAVGGSYGMFLWAKVMLEYLKGARSQDIQLRRLQEFPTGLAGVYEQLLSEIALSLTWVEAEQISNSCRSL